MKISLIDRFIAFWKGHKIVELYSTTNQRSYPTIAEKDENGRLICRIPRFAKDWEYIEIVLLPDGKLEFSDEKLNDIGLDQWK
jgi:ABC-type bacteriocin/lantibiotic exporter with double-glycine peptidase domain